LASQLGKMKRIFPGSTSEVENSISPPDQGIDLAPDRVSLQSAGLRIGPHFVVARREAIEIRRWTIGS
jgi:hypothetical protein